MIKTGHTVVRDGKHPGDPPLVINVPEELETAPGIEYRSQEVDFYSREYPVESLNIEESAVLEWAWSMYSQEVLDHRREHLKLNKPLVEAAWGSGDIEPTAKPIPGKDMTQEIKNRARDLGFCEVGITKLDMRYVFKSRKKWAKYPHAICLAHEQEYEPTQTAPSMEAEEPHFGTYRLIGNLALELADYIRSLGYHAQVHSANDNSGLYIPMFVEAGLGQLGYNGQLLSPHFGSRSRLVIISTEAPLAHDHPVDYGMTAFCNVCQVCVNRCPGRAILREKMWYRGVFKSKISYNRCRPVVVNYEGCAVCMRVCPVQRFGMKPVLDHYTETGQVLGKGTHLLEGFSMRDMGYFGPGEMPQFQANFFKMPHGKAEDLVFDELKEKIKAGLVPESPEGTAVLRDFKKRVASYVGKTSTASQPGPQELPE